MFERREYSLEYLIMYLSYRHKINKYNIDKLKVNKINKILQDENVQMKFVYLHNILAKFNASFYNEDYIYLDKLKSIINNNKIILNPKEEQFLFLLEGRIFNKNRKLKVLDSNHIFLKRERLYAKYKIGHVYFLDNKYYKNIINGELLITNKRIIIKTFKNYNNFEFFYSEMKYRMYKKYGFEFVYGKEKVLIRSHDQPTLCNIIKRFDKNIS